MKNLRLFISTGIPISALKRSKGVRLSHPRLEKKCVFIALEDFTVIYELQKINLPGRSFIFGNRISKCGDIFFLSPMNVIFLFIPSLLKMDKFTTLDVLIRSDCAPGYPDYFPDSTFDKLCTICESKVTCGLKVLRLNEEKLMDWLNDAVNRIFEAAHDISDFRQMPQLRAILASSSDAAAASGKLDNSALKKLAFQIIADKLPYQLVDKLLSSLGLASLPAADKEGDHNKENDELNALRPAINYGNPTEDCLNNVTTAKPIMAKSAAQTRRMKMAKGTRSITSFFCKT